MSAEHNDSVRQRAVPSRVSQVLAGASWIFLQIVSERIFQLFVFVLLARELGPSDFGAAALSIALPIALVVAVRPFADVIVQRNESNPENLSTIFWTSSAVGLVLSIIVFCMSMVVAPKFFSDPVPRLVAMASPAPFIAGFAAPFEGVLLRECRYRSLALRRAIGNLGGGILGIALVYLSVKSASLIVYTLSGLLIGAVISINIVSWRPSFTFRYRYLVSVVDYIAFCFLNSFVVQITSRLPDMIIGAALGPAATGIFRLAKQIVDNVAVAISNPLMTSLFPAMSRLNHDQAATGNATFHTISVVVVISSFLAMNGSLLSFFIASERVFGAWGEAIWLCGVLLQMLPALVGASVSQVVYSAGGNTRILFALSSTQLAVLTITVAIFSQWSLTLAAIAVVAVTDCMLIIYLINLRKIVGAAIYRVLIAFIGFFVLSAAALGLINCYYSATYSPLSFGISLLVANSLYIGLVLICAWPTIRFVWLRYRSRPAAGIIDRQIERR